ncbi:MAG: efflux RND transporter periplasmic adaptor subunit [Anaerovibrio slackiae]|uniref:efflux RND transporter periplasmic adaptor subunit n=1 Tax=Anaerovibrio slackiae TaxID=2652309 RepID=UPI0023F07D0E|nr:efflux RND transporter periplasmic adaptor subunit [Anaerovibrio slackiae]MBQ2010973.1 efflux RND transporter periplasmic adaptor subunit [Selenomonadaceae bacterium]MBQ5586217.1 efflux RND transporter periplasmic adaptor subunit [Selenomonadaceae bacterium]MBQ5919882.1 efflux RND transporter periplasmic adaptor subunit [Selenomonadaceae bacterium]MDD6164555.1 efflux RND transporter periplasmic adaptor subunit [Anaerovibrio slackiae]
MAAKKKAVLFLAACLLGLAAYLYHAFCQQDNQEELVLQGNVDVREVSLAFRQSDRILEMLAEEGDRVQKGQVLARLDTQELKLQLQRLNAEIAAQQSTVDKLHNGTRPEEIRQAEGNLRQAQAAAEHAAGVYQRKRDIYTSIAGISQQELDNAYHDMEAKQATMSVAEAALQEAKAGPRQEDIAGAEAGLQALRNEQLRYIYLLSQYELQAPDDGVIRSRLLEAGDMASPSKPVFKLSLPGKKWVRAYVPETELGRVYEGQQARVYIDSLPGKAIDGQVGYISGTAEFTPKHVQTEELRTSLVYEVRVYVDDADNVLRLGMPATVRIVR